MTNSQAKGYRGETLWQKFLAKLGIKSERVKRKQGGKDGGACDVVAEETVLEQPKDLACVGHGPITIRVPTIHWEVKNTKKLPPKGVRNALMQARSTANGGPCALAMYVGRGVWGIYLETADWSPTDFGLEPQGEGSK